MKIALRVLAAIINVLMLLNGARFVLDPAGVTAELGMDLQTGVSASTQLGGIGGLFLGGGILLALGQRRGASHWFYPAAILIGSAALMRTLVAVRAMPRSCPSSSFRRS